MGEATGDHGTFLDDVQGVLASQMCSGCGLCAVMDDRLEMQELDGFMRPVFTGGRPPDPAEDAERSHRFRTACPGRRVVARGAGDSPRHPVLGPIQGIWAAHATDEEARHRGSSGGVLTALNTFLLEEGEASTVLGAAARPQDPRRTVPVTITSREEALRAAGSRYGPVATLDGEASPFLPGTAVTGKPCEASAVRAYAEAAGEPAPILLSFFCAGTPQQDATDHLVEKLGIPREEPLADMWYRGRGWPGSFTAVSASGHTVSTSYGESWGSSLGPTVQWRCRVCADGVGESADISAGDYWEADEHGYPEFHDKPGRSVLIARTARGLDIIRRAEAAGVIAIEVADADDVAAMQPYQSSRRRLLAGRLLGTRLLLGRVPTYRGFGIARNALRSPRQVWQELRGTITRIRDRQRRGFRS